MTSIRFENVTRIFAGKVRAVENLDLDIPDGEFLVIAGPSGCGKTTILRLIAGLDMPSCGRVLFDGFNMKNIPPKDRNCAMVFQDSVLYPHMNVYNNIAFPLKMNRITPSQISEKIQKTSRLLEIENLLTRKPHALSGGQRQRVALAKAIVRQPNVFLYDEPLSNLEGSLRNQLKTEIVNFHKKNRTTTVYVTHDQSEALTMGDRICLIKDGSVQQIATPSEIYNNPENIFAARFFGIPPINLIMGLVKRQGEEIIFETQDASFDLPADFNEFLEPYVNHQLVMAIRPEDIFPEPFESYHANSLPVDINSRQLTGPGCSIFMNTPAEQELSMTTRNDSAYRLDEQIIVYLDISRAHFFDLEMNGINVKKYLEEKRQNENT